MLSRLAVVVVGAAAGMSVVIWGLSLLFLDCVAVEFACVGCFSLREFPNVESKPYFIAGVQRLQPQPSYHI